MREITPVGDLDGDGHPDLLVGPVGIGTGWNGMDDLVGVGDLNRDGHNDVIVVETATGLLYLYHGDGAALVRRSTVGSRWQTMRPLT